MMVRSATRFAVVALTVLLLISVAGALSAQIPENFTVTVFYDVRDETDGLTGAEVGALVDTLIASLAAQRDELVFLRVPDGVADNRRFSFEEGAFGWIEIDLTGERELFFADIRVYSVLAAEPLLDQQVEGPFDERLRIFRIIWNPVAERFAEVAGEIVATAVAERRTSTLTFTGLPGTRIHGIEQASGLIGEDGATELELLIPFAYEYDARGRFIYPVGGEVFLGEDDVTVELAQKRKARFFFDGALSELAYPELAAGIYPFGETIYAQLALESYIVGFVPIGAGINGDEERGVFVSEPLTNVHLQFGAMLRAAHRQTRPFASIGPFLRLVHGPYWGAESQSPGGINLRAGAEVGSRSPWRLVLAWRPSLYLSTVGDEFITNFQRPAARIESFLGRSGLSAVIDPFSISVGVRFQPALRVEETGR